MNILKKENLQSIEGLLLLARQQVSGFLQSIHHSQHTGAGQEFSQYRAYQIGDDLRQLDWKMYARSDRFYVKEAEQERNHQIHFLVDATASMQHTEKEISKLDFARYLTATLAYLAYQQKDTLALSTIHNENHQDHPLPNANQLQHLLNHLVKTEAQGKWTKDLKNRQKNKAQLLVFISDLHEEKTEIQETLQQLNTRQTEIIVFHLMTQKEINFDYKGTPIFENLESGKKVSVNIKEYRETYLAKKEAYITKLQNKFRSININYQLVNTSENLSAQLRLFLNRRKRLLA